MILILAVLVNLFVVYFVFNPKCLGEFFGWYWNKIKTGCLWLWGWLKGLSQ